MAYHTNVGPISGPLHNKHRYIAIGVFQAREIRSPIGLAMADGQGQDGLILWRLTINEAELPGRWVVVDRGFRPATSAEHRRGGDCPL
jgi:hypothetical protein